MYMYKKFISQLHKYEKALRILSKGQLAIFLLPPSKILGKVKKVILITNPDYDIIIKRLYLWYETSYLWYL